MPCEIQNLIDLAIIDKDKRHATKKQKKDEQEFLKNSDKLKVLAELSEKYCLNKQGFAKSGE